MNPINLHHLRHLCCVAGLPDSGEAVEQGGVEELAHASRHDEDVALAAGRRAVGHQPLRVAEDVIA